MTPPTFADALAACRARWGEPVDPLYWNGLEAASWEPAPGCFYALEDDADGCDLLAHAHGEERMWLLRGTAPAGWDAPLTPLPDALAAAVAWLAERTPAPTKGP